MIANVLNVLGAKISRNRVCGNCGGTTYAAVYCPLGSLIGSEQCEWCIDGIEMRWYQRAYFSLRGKFFTWKGRIKRWVNSG